VIRYVWEGDQVRVTADISSTDLLRIEVKAHQVMHVLKCAGKDAQFGQFNCVLSVRACHRFLAPAEVFCCVHAGSGRRCQRFICDSSYERCDFLGHIMLSTSKLAFLYVWSQLPRAQLVFSKLDCGRSLSQIFNASFNLCTHVYVSGCQVSTVKHASSFYFVVGCGLAYVHKKHIHGYFLAKSPHGSLLLVLTIPGHEEPHAGTGRHILMMSEGLDF
jgi:hypothetical protein